MCNHESIIRADEEKFERQVELELEMRNLGVSKYRETLAQNRTKGRESFGTRHGTHLLKASVEPVAKAIKEWTESVLAGGRGRRHKAVKYLQLVDPYTVAFITAKTALDQLTLGVSAQQVASKIGIQIEDECRFRKFEEAVPGLFRWLQKNNTDHPAHKRRVLIYTMNKHVEWEDWGKVNKLHLGMKCLELFVEATGVATLEEKWAGKKQQMVVVSPTEKTMEWIKEKNARLELMYPILMPTIVEPKDWTDVDDGGYWTNAISKMSLVKVRNKNFLEEFSNHKEEMPTVFTTINLLQKTAWKINSSVLETAKVLWRHSHTVAKLPSREDLQPPVRPTGLPEDLKKQDMKPEQREVFDAWKKDVSAIHNKNVKLRSKRLQTEKILTIASKFEEEPEIFFPYQYDFRGRVYAIPMFLNPQGNDLAKGLLTLARGKPIEDETAANWLAIQGANVYGADKISLTDRVLWAYTHEEDIKAVAADPIANQWWAEADKPWQFLAWCFEWAGFLEEGFGFVSSLPVALDGSCNGLQHYSAMLRDEVGGRSVNLVPQETPADIYQDVADVVVNKLSQGLVRPEECQLAHQWLNVGISRKTTKRSVMVVPYSGTLFACRKYIDEHLQERLDEGLEDPFNGEHFAASKFLAGHVWDAIGEVVIKGREAMDWLQKTARLVSKEGLPITWKTPDGFLVQQAYHDSKAKRVKTKFGESFVYLTLREELPELDSRRQANGIAPNFVHSMDATALRMTVDLAALNGVSQFAMVHDSYGTTAADTEVLAQVLRHAFVEMYQENDVLEDFKSAMEPLLSEGKELTELPEKGNLDLEQVLESDFFFA